MRIPWTARKTDFISGGKNINTETVLLGNIMRKHDYLEKAMMLGKVEGNKKRGGPNTRWIESLKEATGLSLEELRRAVGERAF